jgi:hypothetical protein
MGLFSLVTLLVNPMPIEARSLTGKMPGTASLCLLFWMRWHSSDKHCGNISIFSYCKNIMTFE